MRKQFDILIVVISLTILSTGCRPDGVLTSRQMRQVLYDLHRADGILQMSGYGYGHQHEMSIYYHNVLADHGITQAQFDSSLVWYTDHPQLFDKIYPKVEAQLQADVDALRAQMDDEQLLKNRLEEEKRYIIRYENADSLAAFYRNGYPNPWHIWEPDTVPATERMDCLAAIKPDTLIMIGEIVKTNKQDKK